MKFIIIRLKNNSDINMPQLASDLFDTSDFLNIGKDWIIYTQQSKEMILEILNNIATEFLFDFIAYVGNDQEKDPETIRQLLKDKFSKTVIYDDKKLIIELIKNNKIEEYNPFKHIVISNELLETVNVFLENDMNLSKTATKMYLHRNTLIQRLDKFKRDTGYDLKKFDDAFICYYFLSKL